MTKEQLLKLAENKIIILDGANGSNLHKKGMPPSVCPEKWMIENKEEVISLQLDYLRAGTDILYAPTFTCSRIKLLEYGLSDATSEMNREIVKLSNEAVRRYKEENKNSREIYVAGNMTMTGQQLYPIGTLQFEELVQIYKEQVMAMLEASIDLIAVETMMSLRECRAAVIAIKECTELPFMVTLTFNEDGKTLYGTDPKTAVIVLQNLGAAAIGVNCSTGPEHMESIIKRMKKYARVPIIAKPNAGLPELIDGKTVFRMEPDEFASKMAMLVSKGAGIVGGCCGTTPEHIRKLANISKTLSVPEISSKKIRALTTERKTLEINLDGRLMIVGERINPTGKKALQEELRNDKWDIVCAMAEEQEKNGADILDINLGMNGIDEKEMMVKAIYEIMNVTDLPLCIDSSHADVIEAALRIYPGRALINSISLEKKKIEELIPIAVKYGAMFILLPLSENGLPKDMNEKKAVIHEIMNKAKEAGLTDEDIIVDGLVNTVGANKDAAHQTLETISYCRNELKLATICGLSNISFGLPERQYINSTFFAFCIKEGLTMAIANPSQELLMNTLYASELLINKEGSDIRYIESVSEYRSPIKKNDTKKNDTKEKNSNKASIKSDNISYKKMSDSSIDKREYEDTTYPAVYMDVVKGRRNNIIGHIMDELNRHASPEEILNNMLIPAVNEAGNLFEQKIYYLPQLIASAETMRMAADYLKPFLSQEGTKKKLGTIIIATVEGDIHDIGKNLVSLMLNNHGFNVIDLGKDVKSEDIINAAIEHNADIIALSALMTTTMTKMKRVVELRNEHKLLSKVMIGGAVITQSYCDEIGAEGYSKDANEAVEVAKRLL